MAKSMFTAAAAALAFSGAASAFPQLGFNNVTSGVALSTGATASPTTSLNVTSSSTSSSATTTASSGSNIKYCPNLDGQFVIGPLDISYQISCSTNHLGVIIDINLEKRATPSSLTDCLNECSELSQCVAASYDTNNPTCYLFSSVGAAFADSGFQFAEKASALASSTGSSTSSATAVATGTGSSNGTSTTNGTSSALESLFCPQLDAQVYQDGNGVSYIIECGDNHVGTVISVAYAKRATATSILDCLAQCDANSECVGTGYNKVQGSCTLFSAVGAEYYDQDVDFAVKVADASGTTGTTGTTGTGVVTGVVFQTVTSTIYSCAPTVTNCPLRAGQDSAVVTDVVVDYTTVCPASELPSGASVVGAYATGPVAAVTATIYSTTVSTIYSCSSTVLNCPLTSGSSSVVTSMAAVATSVINYPVYSVISSSAVSGVASATVSGPTATSSGLTAFTGAANALNAGMGMAGAVIAAGAFLL